MGKESFSSERESSLDDVGCNADLHIFIFNHEVIKINSAILGLLQYRVNFYDTSYLVLASYKTWCVKIYKYKEV